MIAQQLDSRVADDRHRLPQILLTQLRERRTGWHCSAVDRLPLLATRGEDAMNYRAAPRVLRQDRRRTKAFIVRMRIDGEYAGRQ